MVEGLWVTTVDAARRLQTSKPTILALLAKGQLSGTPQPRGTRFSWRVDEGSLERFLAHHGPYDGRRKTVSRRLEEIEAQLSSLSEAVRGLQAAPKSTLEPQSAEEIGRDRDGLRARVVNLEEALTRAHAVAELQREADGERAAVVEHLLAAAAASERADALRRRSVAELEEAVAVFSRPGHPGEMGQL